MFFNSAINISLSPEGINSFCTTSNNSEKSTLELGESEGSAVTEVISELEVELTGSLMFEEQDAMLTHKQSAITKT